MRLLDPKEEVYKIKITPYGKYLLSQGKFNPQYYAFFDDDVIYDSSYLSNTGDSIELQNNIQTRILDETPRFEGQTSFEGCETTVFATYPNLLEEIFPGIGKKVDDPSYDISIIEKPINQYFLQNPLGQSDFNSKKAPFFSVNMIEGGIASASILGSGSSDYFNNKSEAPTTFINQIDMDLINEITIHNIASDTAPTKDVQDDELFDSFYVFQDGTSIVYDKKRIFLKLEEGNTRFLKENFDIEIFEVIEQTGSNGKTTQQLKKYYFTEEDKESNLMNIEYYFNLKLDNEIEESYFCEATKNSPNKTKDIFSDKTFKCPEQKQELINVNIYNTDKLEDPEDAC